jgi:endonuclease YncB( thermonuclease family)
MSGNGKVIYMLEVLLCLVVAVADGDTLTARCGEPGHYQQVKVRLAEIDAPEKGQPFGNRSRLSLASLCAGTIATIKATGKDRYGRSIARVQCKGVDANGEQVRRGMAWAFTRYLTDDTVRVQEGAARVERVGLWADEAPEAPWSWRARAKSKAIRPVSEGAEDAHI